jgi:thiol-disulfide isomerase/thioredoxin
MRNPIRRGLSALLLLCVLPCAVPVHATDIDLKAYKGKVVYLDFWASWCVPCRRSFPWLDGIYREYKARGLVVIGVNVDADHSLAENFLKDTPVGFPIVYDPAGQLAARFKIQGMPSAVLIGRDGKIQFQHIGFTDNKEGEYETHVESLLAEPAN